MTTGGDILSAVAADPSGAIFDLPEADALGRSGDDLRPLRRDECIPLPAGSELFLLPGRDPLGVSRRTGEPIVPGEGGLTAVAAFLSPAHTHFYTAAYLTRADAPMLPLFAYTAVGWHRGRFYVPACRIDPDRRQDIGEFSSPKITRRARALKRRHRENRLRRHLLDCALCSGCPAARNLVLGRWEAPLPTSTMCNARCLGCLSLQPPGSCPATQERITFTPRLAEVVEIAVPHLESAPRAVVSFGQGCEGEPLLRVRLIEESIREIRRLTPRGTINLNTNASRPAALARLFEAGLDSVRVSLNSARPEVYRRYFRPRGYDFDDVVESLRTARRHGRFSSLNYFVFPGVTDDPAEVAALEGLIEETAPGLIQWRNLNMDPERYWAAVGGGDGGIGVARLISRLRRRFPRLRHGYFNPPLRGPRGYHRPGSRRQAR